MTPAAPASSQPERPDVFISYSRRDGDFVRPLVRALEARGKDVWVDLDDIPKSADWHARVEEGIEASKAVVVVLSPSLAASQICGEEIRHAIEHNKRLIPILRTDVEPEQLYPELNAPNWILARDQDDGEAAFEELIAALETDLAWLEVHARLVARSVEWDRQNRDGSFLLRGGDLGTARRWLDARAEHREQPTALQVEYIGASRRSTLIRRAIVAVAALGVVALSGFLLVQRERTSDEQQRAERQEKLAESRRLAADALEQLESDSRRALATAVRAHESAATPEATQALRRALMQPRLEAALSLRRGAIWSAKFTDPDTVRARTEDGRILVWRVGGGEPVVTRRGPRPRRRIIRDAAPTRAGNLSARPGFDRVHVTTTAKGSVTVIDELRLDQPEVPRAAVLSPDGRRVLTVGYRAAADVWRIPALVFRAPQGGLIGCVAAAATYTVTCDDRGRVAIWPSDPSSPPRIVFDGPGGKYEYGRDVRARMSVGESQVFVTSERRGTLNVIDAETGEVIGPTYRAEPYAPPLLSSDGRRLWVPLDSKIKDAKSGRLISTLPVRNNDFMRPPAFDLRGDRIAVYLGDGVRVWDTARPKLIARLPRPREQLDAFAISPSGRYVATAENQVVRVFESDGGSAFRRYPVNGRVNEIGFSRDDRFIVTAGTDLARVSELKTGRRVASSGGHRGDLLGASFGPGARTVATVGFDGLAIVHDCPACAPPATLVKRARAALRAVG